MNVLHRALLILLTWTWVAGSAALAQDELAISELTFIDKQYMQQQREISVLEQARTDRELALRQAEFLRQKIVFENANHERKKAYLGEAKVLIARLAAQSNDPQSRQRFEELYYADLIGVEKLRGPVEQAMVAFRNLLVAEASAQDLRDQSLVLSRAVETELKESEDNILEQWRQVSNLITR